MSGWRDRIRGKHSSEHGAEAGTIHLTLVDAASNDVLGEADLDARQLPDAFDPADLSTTMHIGGVDWSVEDAEPRDRSGYEASGRLRLVVRKIEMMPSEAILFSLPTIVDAVPPTRASTSTEAFALHEDDWRQREFVAAALGPEITAEFEMIRAARASRVDGGGYQQLHVREQIPEPLAGVMLSLSEIHSALGAPIQLDLAVGNGLVIGGFAFAVTGGVVYGRTEQGFVATFALTESAEAQPFHELAAEHALVLVDWVRTVA